MAAVTVTKRLYACLLLHLCIIMQCVSVLRSSVVACSMAYGCEMCMGGGRYVSFSVACGAAGEGGAPSQPQKKPGFKLEEAYRARMVGIAAAMADGPLWEVRSAGSCCYRACTPGEASCSLSFLEQGCSSAR